MTKARSNAVAPAAKGDLQVGSGSLTSGVLGVGSDGAVLQADSTATNGVSWAGPLITAGKNAVINGGFDIWQRGTSLAGPTSYPNYTADRWQGNRYGGVTGSTFSRQTSSLTGTQYCMRAQRDSGNTSTALVQLSQSLESVNSIPFAGQTVTVSFWARAGANYSSSGNGLSWKLGGGTGTDQNYLTNGYTGQTDIIFQSATLTTSWQRFTYTASVGSTITELALYFYYTPVGTAGANDYFEITGVQLELGSSATPFSRAGGTIQGELAACQRYYWRWNGGGTYRFTGAGAAYSTTQASIYIAYPTTMRTGATALDTSGMTCHLLKNDSYNSSGSFSLANQQESNTQVIYTHGSGIFTAGDFVNLSNGATSTGYIGFTAEL